MQPLADLKVLDLSWHVAGPYCTKLLADYGADVIKVERPLTGDPSRSYGPFPQDVPHQERSGAFLHLNTNKQSITVNLKDAAGRRIILQLARWADVVVDNFSPGTLAGLGLGHEELAALNPRLVCCSISNFGQTGPYRDWKATEFILAAMAGFTYITGVQEREPLKSVDHLQEYQGGAHGALAIMGSVLRRQEQGAGEVIDVSIFEVAAGSPDRRGTYLSGYAYTGLDGKRESPLGGALPLGMYPCKDGFINIVVSPPGRWPRFLEMLGRGDLVQELEIRRPGYWATPQARELVDTLLYPWLLERTKQEVFDAAQRARIAAAPLNTPTQALAEPHLQARGYFAQASHPVAGLLPYTGPSFRMEGEGWMLRSTAPLLGQHNEKVLGGLLGLSAAELTLLRETGAI